MISIQSALALRQIDRDCQGFEELFQEQLSQAEIDFADTMQRLRLSIEFWTEEHRQDPLKGPLSAQRAVVLKEKLQSTVFQAIEEQIQSVHQLFQDKITLFKTFQNRMESTGGAERGLLEQYIENFSDEGLEEVETQLDNLQARFKASPEAYRQASISQAMEQLLQLRVELDQVCNQAAERYPVGEMIPLSPLDEEQQREIAPFELETLSYENPKDIFKKLIDILISLLFYLRILVQYN